MVAGIENLVGYEEAEEAHLQYLKDYNYFVLLYETTGENRFTEDFLYKIVAFDSFSYSDREKQMIEYMQQRVRGVLDIQGIEKTEEIYISHFPDWNAYPEAYYWAVNFNGKAFYSISKPQEGLDSWHVNGKIMWDEKFNRTQIQHNYWRYSLHERPLL